MSLVLVQADGEYLPVKRRGTFTVERELTKNPAHLKGEMAKWLDRFIALQALLGLEHMPELRPELRGPFEHVVAADDSVADEGPDEEPQLHQFLTAERYVEACERYERRVKAGQIARKVGETPDLVDYQIVLAFRKRRLRQFHQAARHAAIR